MTLSQRELTELVNDFIFEWFACLGATLPSCLGWERWQQIDALARHCPPIVQRFIQAETLQQLQVLANVRFWVTNYQPQLQEWVR